MTSRRTQHETDDDASTNGTPSQTDGGKGELAKRINADLERGYVGKVTEEKPNSAFTVAGVTNKE